MAWLIEVAIAMLSSRASVDDRQRKTDRSSDRFVNLTIVSFNFYLIDSHIFRTLSEKFRWVKKEKQNDSIPPRFYDEYFSFELHCTRVIIYSRVCRGKRRNEDGVKK